MTRVKYMGDGRYLNGVPAADHEAAEEDLDVLLGSGLYEKADKRRKAKDKDEQAPQPDVPVVAPEPDAPAAPEPAAAADSAD